MGLSISLYAPLFYRAAAKYNLVRWAGVVITLLSLTLHSYLPARKVLVFPGDRYPMKIYGGSENMPWV